MTFNPSLADQDPTPYCVLVIPIIGLPHRTPTINSKISKLGDQDLTLVYYVYASIQEDELC